MANCHQNRLDNVSAYVTAFFHCANHVHDLMDAKALDWFMRGLHPVLLKDILMKDPHMCEDALIAAERIGAIHNCVMGKGGW